MESKYYGIAKMRSLEGEEGKLILEGYALKFERPTQPEFKDLYGYNEKIGAHALDDTDLSDVPLKYNHSNEKIILARTRNKSLNLKIDDIGLYFRAVLNDKISDHINVYQAVKSGLIDQCSFCMLVDDEMSDYDSSSRTITINKITNLLDISIVDAPAYDSTEVYARNLEKLNKKAEELELRKRKLKLKMSL